MQKSEDISELAKAMIGFHKKLSPIAKNKKNPFFNSKYVGLPDILELVRPILCENNLSISQLLSSSAEGDPVITTMLMHSSGQYINSSFIVTVEPTTTKKDQTPRKRAQGIGSATTYGKRYSLCAVLGIAEVEDDDANYASGNYEQPKKQLLQDKLIQKPKDQGVPYDPENTEHTERLGAKLNALGIDKKYWIDIGDKMKGKTADKIEDIANEYKNKK